MTKVVILGYTFTLDAILQAVGALLGALIAGILAILVMCIQIYLRNRQIKKEKLENFIKASKIIISYSKKIYASSKSVLEPLYELSDIYIQEKLGSKDFVKINIDDINNYRNIIDKINSDYVFEDIFDCYLNIRNDIDEIIFYIERSISNNAETTSLVKKYSNSLNEQLKNFIEYSKEKEEELKKLK